MSGPRASEYLVEVAPDPCVRQDLGGWTAVFRVGPEGQGIAKVEILPGDGHRRGKPGPSVAETLSAYGIDNLEDAAGSKVLPAGAPATGLGGTAPAQKSSGVTWLAFISAGLLIVVSGLIRFRRGRRPGLSMR